MTKPDMSMYRDVHKDSGLPRVKQVSIENYLSNFDAVLQDTPKNLYKDRFLAYVRQTYEDGKVFLHAKCYSEMTKNASYIVDIQFDTRGIPQQAQCECGAGQGPDAHCKHIQTVMWGLVQLSSTGELLTEETCTQKLQTFHKAKKMAGSPCKTQDLPLGCPDFDYDPRPQRFINAPGYPDFVRNLVLNYGNKDPMPIEMTIEPANPFAVNHDHTYGRYNLEEQFLINNSITTITPSERDAIQQNTITQGKSKAWKSE